MNYLKGLRELLLAEKARLEVIKQRLDSELAGMPAGNLRICKSNNRTQYYHHKSDSIQDHGTYIPVAQHDLAGQLAQKAYDRKVYDLVSRRLRQLTLITKDYKDDEIEEIYRKMTNERKNLVTPVEKTGRQQIEEWINTEYTGKGFKEDDVFIYTENGERVRSKTEKIIADYLYHNNIPYKYEKPLLLKGYGTVYPDFTLLSPHNYEELYWEHEGRMDDQAYAASAVKKIKSYEENGIYAGERLILTFETQKTVLNTGDIERVVNRFLR